VISKEGIKVPSFFFTNVAEIRSLWGLVGYHRKFVKDFSKIASNMTNSLIRPLNLSGQRSVRESFRS